MSEKELRRLTESLTVTAPDGLSLWNSKQIGLGHCFLRTSKTQAARNQTYADENFHLICDARLDNRLELSNKIRAQLAQESVADHLTETDAELIVSAYRAWGTDCVQHLIGDFAFAIWDSRLQHLFCTRDQLGVKQFFYYYDGSTFIFSNALSALRLHPLVSDELNEQAVADFFLFGLNQEKSSTIFHDIKPLPQAHSLTVSRSGLTVKEYWRPCVGEIRYKNDAEYVDRFSELLDQAVTDRSQTDRISLSMSGGLDSSGVAAYLTRKLQGTSSNIKAFCVLYEKAFRDDERTYAQLVAEHLELPIEFLDGVALNELDSSRSTGCAPEPFNVDPIYVVSDHLLNALANHSRVALTGWDGDTFLDETPRHLFRSLFTNGRFLQLVKSLAAYITLTRRLPPIGIRTKWRDWRHPDWNDLPFPSFLNDSFTEKHDLVDRWRHFNRTAVDPHPVRPKVFRICGSPSWASLLNSYDSGVTGLKLEVRHPLLDLRLVEFALSLPVIPWLLEKRILRASLNGKLPDPVIIRPKSPLAGDPGLQLRYSTKLRNIDEFRPLPGLSKYINRAAVPSVSSETDRNQLWMNLRPFSFNEWLRKVYYP